MPVIATPKSHAAISSTSGPEEQRALAREILDLVFHHRRLLPQRGSCGGKPCAECYAPHLDKLVEFIRDAKPIRFVLPAFPAKSPNLSKVLGNLPDLGERLSLDFLQDLCDKIGRYYSPGAEIVICSDGRVFGPLVGVTDDDVSAYGAELRNLARELRARAIRFFSLEDVFDHEDYERMRADVVRDFGPSLDDIVDTVKQDGPMRSMFNGMHRFLYEDRRSQKTGLSNSKLREMTKQLAYDVIRHSNAWSSLVESHFPEALRLSIHPQPFHSGKIGIKMLKGNDVWGTPWHGVVFDDGRDFLLMKRREAEELGGELFTHNGRPSHFCEPSIQPRETML